MIQHFHPKSRLRPPLLNGKDVRPPKVNEHFLRWATHKVPDTGLLPGQRMIRHWNACLRASEDLESMPWTDKRDLERAGWFTQETLNASTTDLHNTARNASRQPRGAVFEAIGYDCFMHFGHTVPSIYSYASALHRPAKKGEFDLEVHGSGGRVAMVPMKTSMRERGPSQFDLAFVVFERDQQKVIVNSTSLVALTLEEHAVDSPVKSINHARRVTTELYSLNGKIISAHDDEMINSFFHEELAACPCGDAVNCLLGITTLGIAVP